jgi:DNA-directed RNA polymerase subunit RPC12/RpoP
MEIIEIKNSYAECPNCGSVRLSWTGGESGNPYIECQDCLEDEIEDSPIILIMD